MNTRNRAPARVCPESVRRMVGSPPQHRSAVREPGASPGRSRRCEGRSSPATTPLARGPGRRREGEPRVRRPAASVTYRTPRGREEGDDRCHDDSPSRRRHSLSRSFPHRAHCRTSAASATTFPVTITAGNGKVTVSKRPTRIVSLSPTATEIAVRDRRRQAGDRRRRPVRLPEEAPRRRSSRASRRTSRRSPAYRPDLVVVVVRPEGPRRARSTKLGIPVLLQRAATTIPGAYAADPPARRA